MDDRAQHGYPQATHADGRGAEHGQRPWPSVQSPQAGAPIAGQAPYPGPGMQTQHAQQPQQPQHQPFPQQYPQQFPGQAHPQQQPRPFAHQAPIQGQGMQYQYAPGFVMPGAPTDAQPMSAHGGTIGMPMQPAHPDTMPMLHGGAQQQHHAFQPGPQQAAPMHHPQMYGAAAAEFASQPQQWAYPTPEGLQLVQPGDAAGGAHHSPSAATPRPGGRRMKWETVVPAAAVVCLVAAIGLFISDFDRITGREASGGAAMAKGSTPLDEDMDAGTETGTGSGAASTTSEDVDATLDQATKLFRQGSFEDAANLMDPMLDVATPDERVVELHDRIDAAKTRNDALLTRLGSERNAGRWTAVIRTLGQLERLRPLSPSLARLRTSARTALASGRTTAARPRARAAAPSTSMSRGRSGAGRAAPAAGGRSNASMNMRPPATSPTAPAGIPPRPDANPIVNGGGGIGAAPAGG